MSILRERQHLFATLLPRLLDEIHCRGYACTLGEVHRPREWAKEMYRSGKGTLTSLHIEKLAIDIHLFKDDEYLMTTEAHEPFGAFWESLHPLCRWGGRFKSRPDGNHYSVEYGGRA